MPLSMLSKVGGVEIKPTRMTLQLADHSIKLPYGVVEDVLVKVDKYIFPANFVIMDRKKDVEVPLILGRPFMMTAHALYVLCVQACRECSLMKPTSNNIFVI